jgi:serine/threonine protein kinase
MAAQTESDSPSTAPVERTADPAASRLVAVLRQTTLGKFEIYGELGRGGMAVVFLGYDLQLDRHVAIKVMAPQLMFAEGMSERFRREARIAAGLNHPHIIPVYDVRETEELSFIVMKYIDGCSLESVIRSHAPLPIDMVRTLLLQVGRALDHAHRRGVVHRDVKPANILIDSEGTAVVTDFGIARSMALPGLTVTGASVGTPYYMSPEQCLHTEVMGQADQYSLGVVAYEMLCGRVPFLGADRSQVMEAHVTTEPPLISVLRPDCPEDLAHTIHRMLRKKPEDRWPSLAEAMTAIRVSTEAGELVRSQLITLVRTGSRKEPLPVPPSSPIPVSRASPPPGTRQLSRTLRTHWRWLVPGAVAAVILAVAVVRGRPEPPQVAPGPASSEVVVIPPGPAVDPVGAPADATTAPPAPVTPPRATRPGPAEQRTTGQAAAGVGRPPEPQAEGPSPTSPAPADAWVLIGTRHERAFLYINGVPQLPQAPPLRWWRVAVGRVTFALVADGCEPWEQTLALTGGDSVQIGYRFPTCPP